jgi:hypothetical protein
LNSLDFPWLSVGFCFQLALNWLTSNSAKSLLNVRSGYIEIEKFPEEIKLMLSQPRKVEWQNLYFSSVSEVKIAQALDRVGVLFFPNCRGRLTTKQGRRNRECDFLVCNDGIWGILEVDGAPYHPPCRAAEDHKRDGFFLDHGVWVHRFDSNECFKYPDDVVQRFLQRLKRLHSS